MRCIDPPPRRRAPGGRHRRLRADLDAVRLELQPLIVEATRADRIRVICREAGVEPLKQGPRRRIGT